MLFASCNSTDDNNFVKIVCYIQWGIIINCSWCMKIKFNNNNDNYYVPGNMPSLWTLHKQHSNHLKWDFEVQKHYYTVHHLFSAQANVTQSCVFMWLQQIHIIVTNIKFASSQYSSREIEIKQNVVIDPWPWLHVCYWFIYYIILFEIIKP